MLVLRLGPFCHGEVYQGGIPSWVHEKAGQNPKYKIRARTPGFLEDCTELYNTIFAQVNGLLWKDGGPVVGVQIENESRGPWDYLEALKNIAVKAGLMSRSIHVPVGLHFGEKRFSGNCCALW